MTAFCKQAAHKLGKNNVQQSVEDYCTRFSSRVCKIFWHTFVKLCTSSDVDKVDCFLLTVATAELGLGRQRFEILQEFNAK